MPIYRYRGYKPDGAEASGTIEAEGPNEAALKLRERGLLPKEIGMERRKGPGRADAAALPFLTRQLATLLGSGVPIIDALKSLSEEAGPRWRPLLSDIREKVSQGSSLWRAMEEYPGIFPVFYRGMVQAGEASGALPASLSSIADFLEKQATVREKIRNAMVYPSVMAGVGFFVVAFILTFVIPRMVSIFEDAETSLPLITLILIFVSNIFVRYWWLIAALIVGTYFLIRYYKDRNREAVDALLMKIPGGTLQSMYYWRFTLTLGFLLEGGLPMLGALELAGRSMGNSVLEEKVRHAAAMVAEGARLSASLEGFPPVLLQLIRTGERGGKLPELLKTAAVSYEEDFTRRLDRAVSLMEPAMIILMGLIVGFIVIAVLLPIFEMNQLV